MVKHKPILTERVEHELHEPKISDGVHTLYLSNDKTEAFRRFELYFKQLKKVAKKEGAKINVKETIDYIIQTSYVENTLAGFESGDLVDGALKGFIVTQGSTSDQMSEKYKSLKAGIRLLQAYRKEKFGSRLKL